MKKSQFFALARSLFFSLALGASSFGADGVVDLTSLKNYAAQTVPAYITRNNTESNQITNIGATLGRVLFHDKRLSRDNTVSCASCHQQAHAFGDVATASTGVAGTTGRHGMRLVNARFAAEVRFFWDERANTLEAQTTQPIQNHVEMGFSGADGDPGFAALVTKLSAIQEYRVLFAATFGSSGITEDRIQRAIAQFVRSIQSFDSRYDAGRAIAGSDNPPFPNFTAAENAGKQLFLAPPGAGGAGCAGCHRPPEFDIDPASRNNGVITAIGGGTDLTNTRAPSLRDLVGPGGQSNGPFMHNGSLTTLLQVINHYDAIPGDNANLDQRLRRPGGVQDLNLTNQQKNNLVAFLQTLTGTAVYTDSRWSDPFDANGQLSLIILPSDAISIRRNANGTATITARGVPNLAYQIQQSTDYPNWSHLVTVSATAAGLIEHTVSISGNKLFRVVYTVPSS